MSQERGRPRGGFGGRSDDGGGRGGRGKGSGGFGGGRPNQDGERDPRRNASGRERSAARSRGERSRSAQAPGQRAKAADPARNAAFDVLRAVESSDSYANLVLPPLLRKRGIRGRDAGFATELAYGTLRMRGLYDAILAQCTDRPLSDLDPAVLDVLRLGVHQVLGMRVKEHAAVSETVGLARERVGAGPAQLVNAVLRNLTDGRTSEVPDDDSGSDLLTQWLARLRAEAPDAITGLATVYSHPVWIARALREALVANHRDASELEALLAADNAAPLVTLVARPGFETVADLQAQVPPRAETTPGSLVPTALRIKGADPGSFPAVRDGRAGIQDEGSQAVTLAFAAAPLAQDATGDNPDATWLDMCAGPGGKAALLGALAAERGAHLLANEVAPHRADLVRQAVRALPPGTVEVQTGDGRDFAVDAPGRFDRVLLDAPCTGLGALRRRPESRWRRTPADLAVLTVLQRELLTAALAAVRVGGVVGYVTCSPHIAETIVVVEDVIRAVTKAAGGTPAVERLDAVAALRSVLRPDAEDVDLGPGPDLQLWPHIHGTDAMHLTLLRRLA